MNFERTGLTPFGTSRVYATIKAGEMEEMWASLLGTMRQTELWAWKLTSGGPVVFQHGYYRWLK